ncbi:MAG: large conductance mechanosensitive channel protein MscL [Terrimicrobiaceae bacterium]|nr:large conductance mechanosensitive channel protein MscL [Terrimicrobiaceae bacterium]
MKILDELNAFISRGNVIDLAVGVIIGGAFGKIVSSLVNDVVMPPIGLLLANVNFSNLFIALNGQTYASLAQAREKGAPVLAYGAFINSVIEFLIVAACIFLMVKAINKIHAAPPPAPAAPPRSEQLLEEIRDLLKK